MSATSGGDDPAHGHPHGHPHEHEHDHEHEHEHSELGEMDLRVRALESLAHRKGYLDPAALDALIDTYQTRDRPAQRRPRRRPGLGRSGLSRLAAARRDRGDRIARLQRPPGRAHGRAREHRGRAQPRRLHALQLLSLAGARPAAGLVQERALPLARRHRPARRARRLRRHAAGDDRDPGLGLDRRSALPRDPAAPGRHRGARRGRARRAGDARLDDRHRSRVGAGRNDELRHACRSRRPARPRPRRPRARRRSLPRRLGSARHGADAGDGRDRRVEHRHEPRRPRDAARLRGARLLADLARSARKAARRARPRRRRRDRLRADAAAARAGQARAARRRRRRRAGARRADAAAGAGAGALRDRRARARPLAIARTTTPACPAMRAAASRRSSATTASTSLPMPTPSAWASSRTGSTASCSIRPGPRRGAAARQGISVSFDAWEPYLEPA